jgi:pyruvate dehydrogenase complex dehydrogenase (E1) component
MRILQDFRVHGGAQSCPSGAEGADDVAFSTGLVGLGVWQTQFSSMLLDYVAAHGLLTDRVVGLLAVKSADRLAARSSAL